MPMISDEQFEQRMKERASLSSDLRERRDAQMLDAAVRGDINTLKYCLRRGAHPDAIDRDGNTGLCLTRDPDCTRALLHGRADPLIANCYGRSPLLIHIYNRNLPLAAIIRNSIDDAVIPSIRAAAIAMVDWRAKNGKSPIRNWVYQQFGHHHYTRA